MNRTYYLFSISPPVRAILIILMSIGVLWPLMMLHYFSGYQDTPPNDLAIPTFLSLIVLLVRMKVSNTSLSLTIFGLTFHHIDAFIVTTRQEGKLHRIFIKDKKNETLKSTFFLLNHIPVELVEYINE
ncbi:hypothetical protein I6E85_11240 [Pseudoalteromonas sp. NZS71]|uniref:hypothetical protein n=1 Tax=unclassified Pseudoalteromonas TaxID=194690 RepID=UPI0004630871|nr:MULTISPECIES: hypothetical protein [unclassified Pseudoalteromonas]MBH0061730.1 hypothetical protein [Pseudoalteromonas sp. NZS71]